MNTEALQSYSNNLCDLKTKMTRCKASGSSSRFQGGGGARQGKDRDKIRWGEGKKGGDM